MPELPEVETLRLQLSRLIIGKTIKSIDILMPRSFIGDKRQAPGKKIIGVRRFAKMLVLDLSDGLKLAIHLKMSGQLIYSKNKQQITDSKINNDHFMVRLPGRHTRVIINFDQGDRLYFNDQRIFGWIRVVGDIDDLVKKLGPDPVRDLTIGKFREILKSSKRPVKLVLMDQEKIGGVGNIYANDALFLAGINPKTPANQLVKVKSENLYFKLLKVLKEGIKWGGASKTNFVDAYGKKGQVQEHFYAYDRLGTECLNHCGTKIQKIKLGGRGTFFCPKCQV